MIQPAWQSLSAADGAIAIKKGWLYAVVATTTAADADIKAQVAKLGLTIFDYGSTSADSNNSRQVHAMAQATADGGSIPWSPSFPASLVAHYQITQAWSAPPPTDQPVTPSSGIVPPSQATPTTAIVVGIIAVVAAGGLWWLLKPHRRKLLR
jgi:hypothetical protein